MFVNFVAMPNVNAKTVRDLRRELDKLEADAKANDDKIKYTDAQINKAHKDINQINIDIDNISAEIVAKNKEIEDCNNEIKAKDKEIKQLMEFVQLSQSNSFYLEYVMGAESMTDFMYRLSVSEQVLDYNDKLIKDMNNKIKENEARKVELNNKTKELINKQGDLATNLKILANQKVQLDEYDRSLEDEIKVSRDTLQMYEEAGCKDDDDINVCISKTLPGDVGFTKPFIRGYVTSEYSTGRVNPITGNLEAHKAIDISNSDKNNTIVYPVANGKVANVFWDKYGGNEVVVHHKIKVGGTYNYYSSTYVHLAAVYVKIGDVVLRNKAIGKMGNTGLYTTGAHTHLALSTGLRYKDYFTYNDFVARCFNPRNVISFPAGTYNYWKGR
jgi:peptidoglycan hydrolase CwlO-like protein